MASNLAVNDATPQNNTHLAARSIDEVYRQGERSLLIDETLSPDYKRRQFSRRDVASTDTAVTKKPELKGCSAMKKDTLIKILQKVLETDAKLDFLKKLEEKEIETLVACVRDKVDQG